MTRTRFSVLAKYVMTVGQTFKHRSSLSSQSMIFMPSTAVAKLGLASTFLIGAAVGNHVKKRWETFTQIATEEKQNFHITTTKMNKSLAVQRECNVISKIYSILQNCPLYLNDELVTNFYIDKANKLCNTYLSYWGVLEKSADFALKKLMEDSEWIDDTDHWTRLPPLRDYERPLYSDALLAGVTALWHLSCIKDICSGKLFTDKDLLKIFGQIGADKDGQATPLILKLLANIFAIQTDLQVFHDAGLIEVIKLHAESATPELFLPAWRGMHNLKQGGDSSINHEIYVEGIYPFNPPCVDKGESPMLDIILVHGIRGRASWTWRQHDQQKFKPNFTQEQRRNLLKHQDEDLDALYTCCWPLDWLVASLDIPVRILAVEYNADWQISLDKSPQEACGKSISQHALTISESLKMAKVGDRPILWISHSMGGLIVKHILMNDFKEDEANLGTSPVQEQSVFEKRELGKDMVSLQGDKVGVENLAKNTKGVVFFSVPHHGTPLASRVSQPIVRQLLNPSMEVYEMREESPILSEVHKSFVDIVKTFGTAVLTLNESKPMHYDLLGLDVHFVPAEHANPKVGQFYEVDASHLDICKPVSRDSDAYMKVSAFFQEVIKNL